MVKEKFKCLVTDTLDGSDWTVKYIRVRFYYGGKSEKGKSSRKQKERGDCMDSPHKPFDNRGSKEWCEVLTSWFSLEKMRKKGGQFVI